ncbi:MAG: hypothetical protein R3Y21_03480 [Mycoplasmatota bacterium]
MKNKIKTTFDNITPDEVSSAYMLNNIINKSKKKYSLSLVTACICIMLFTVIPNDSEVMMVKTIDYYFYEDTCYEQVGIYNGSSNNLIKNNDIYELKASENIVVYQDVYIEYRKCEERIYE